MSGFQYDVDAQTFLIFPVVKFHTSMNPSTDPVTRYWPSGEKREHSTWDFWPNCKQARKHSEVKHVTTSHSDVEEILVLAGVLPWCVCTAVWGNARPLHLSRLLYLGTNRWSYREAGDPGAAATSETSERETHNYNQTKWLKQSRRLITCGKEYFANLSEQSHQTWGWYHTDLTSQSLSNGSSTLLFTAAIRISLLFKMTYGSCI